MAATVQPTQVVQVNVGQKAAGARRPTPRPAARFQDNLQAAAEPRPAAADVNQRPAERGEEKKASARQPKEAAPARAEQQAAEAEAGGGGVVEISESVDPGAAGEAPRRPEELAEESVHEVTTEPITVVATVEPPGPETAEGIDQTADAADVTMVANAVAVAATVASPAAETWVVAEDEPSKGGVPQDAAARATPVPWQRPAQEAQPPMPTPAQPSESHSDLPSVSRPEGAPTAEVRPVAGNPQFMQGDPKDEVASGNKAPAPEARPVVPAPADAEAVAQPLTAADDEQGTQATAPAKPSTEPAAAVNVARDAAPARPAAAPVQAPPPPEGRFVQDSHPLIVTAVRTRLLPEGGTMQIRLDPPDLGQLQVSVTVRGGAITALFQTSSDEATRLLSHTLSQLKAALEGQGVTVEKLQVQQARREEAAQDRPGDEGRQGGGEHPGQRDQQRREALNRMWRRMSGAGDPLDVVA